VIIHAELRGLILECLQGRWLSQPEIYDEIKNKTDAKKRYVYSYVHTLYSKQGVVLRKSTGGTFGKVFSLAPNVKLPNPTKKKELKPKIKCLSCGNKFESQHKFNRICPSCIARIRQIGN